MAYQLPIGIPDPTWGTLDAINIAVPTQPVEWPSSSNASWFYVDSDHPNSTDTANINGYPNLPRKTVPASLSAGNKVVVKKTITAITVSSSGTENSPIWLIGVNSGLVIPAVTDTYLKITGSYIIVDGLTLDGTGTPTNTASVAWSIRDGANHVCIRNCVVRNMVVADYNPDRFQSGGAADWYSGLTSITPDTGNVTDCIIYNNIIDGNAGGQTLDYENGRHCIIAGGDVDGVYTVERIWILSNTFNNNPEDGIQLGQTANGSNRNLCRYFYIAGNTISNNGENAIDLKACDRIVVSQNKIYGYIPTSYRSGAVSGSDGSACVINDDGGGPAQSWWIANDIYDCRVGIRNQSSGTNSYFLHNIIHDIKKSSTDAEPISPGNSQGVAYWQSAAGSNAYLWNNTIYNVNAGIYMNNVGTGCVSGNIIAEIANHLSGFPINVNNFTMFTGGYNIYYDVGGNVRQDSNALFSTDLINSNPKILSFYRIEFDSPARDLMSNTTLYNLYASFYSGFINKDYYGNIRTGVWDAGAVEYIARPTGAPRNSKVKINRRR